MTRNFKLIVSYDGTRYFGWEHQQETDRAPGHGRRILLKAEALVPVVGVDTPPAVHRAIVHPHAGIDRLVGADRGRGVVPLGPADQHPDKADDEGDLENEMDQKTDNQQERAKIARLPVDDRVEEKHQQQKCAAPQQAEERNLPAGHFLFHGSPPAAEIPGRSKKKLPVRDMITRKERGRNRGGPEKSSPGG